MENIVFNKNVRQNLFSLDLVKEIDTKTGTLICEFVHVSVLTKMYIESKRACSC